MSRRSREKAGDSVRWRPMPGFDFTIHNITAYPWLGSRPSSSNHKEFAVFPFRFQQDTHQSVGDAAQPNASPSAANM